MDPEREGGLPDARDHEEERGRDDERRERGSEGEPEELPAEAGRRRLAAAGRPLRLDGEVVEHQHPRAHHEEHEEHEQVADPEGERRGGDQHEECQERGVAEVAQGAAHREAVEEQEEQEARQAVERRAREVAEIDRRRDGGDEHERAGEPRHRVHAVAERLAPPRRGHDERGRQGGGVAEQPREVQGREAVLREEERREAERRGVRHAEPSATRISRSRAADGGGPAPTGNGEAVGS